MLETSRAWLFGRTVGNVRRLLPARADDELANPAREVESAARGLRGEALVVVVVPDEHEVGVRVVERLPERGVRRVASVLAGGEPRVVPVRERAGRGRWAARSARSQCSCGEPAPQPPISEQFEFSAMRCQPPRSKL